MPFSILRDWLDDGRIDNGAKLLRADWSEWREVEEVFTDMRPDDEPGEPSGDLPEFIPV